MNLYFIFKKHENLKKLKEEAKTEQIFATKREKVYTSGKYKNNKQQLKDDFNELRFCDRDTNKISSLYPEYIFLFNSENDQIVDILDDR